MKFDCIVSVASCTVLCSFFLDRRCTLVSATNMERIEFQNEIIKLDEERPVSIHGNLRRRGQAEQVTVSLPLVDGTYVTTEDPEEKHDGSKKIYVDDSPFRSISFLKFNTECVNGIIQSIKLKLPVADTSVNGGVVSKTRSDWVSSELIYTNIPDAISNRVSIGKVTKGTVVDISIPKQFLDSSENMVAFRIDPRHNDGADYYKEGIVLEVTYSGPVKEGCTSHEMNPEIELLSQIEQEMEPQSQSSDRYFMIKLYWEQGYYWQETRSERRFCVDCSGDCRSGRVKIRQCDYKREKQFWRYNGGKLESKVSPGYCMSYSGSASRGEKIELKECERATKFQGILTPPNQNRFKWHPLGNNQLCMTNPHHPRDNEELRFNDCETAYRDETAFWVTGSGWTSLGGYPPNRPRNLS